MGLGLGPGLLDVHSSRASKLTPPGRTSAQIHTPQQQRDAAPHPAACPGVWAQPTEGDQGLPFFLSRPGFHLQVTKSPGSDADPAPDAVPAMAPATAALLCLARRAGCSARTGSHILPVPGALLLLGFGLELLQALGESKVQKVVAAHGDVASQAAGKGRRCWLRLGITAQPGARGASTACTMGWESSNTPVALSLLTLAQGS